MGGSAVEEVSISVRALERMTPAQAKRIASLADDAREIAGGMRVFTAFELPRDYVAFTLNRVYGGISAEGQVVST
jgi:hypothetical protein